MGDFFQASLLLLGLLVFALVVRRTPKSKKPNIQLSHGGDHATVSEMGLLRPTRKQ